jgi:DNA mismatch endonuclease, patch repair protein
MDKSYKENTEAVPRFSEAGGFYTTPQRSELMSRIRAKNTKPEIQFRKALWNSGFRYRKYVRSIPGSPDIVITKYKIVIFVDGEFWHGYNWEEKKEKIKTNREYWIPKIERNMERDLENTVQLELLGYKVFRFWESSIKKDVLGCIDEVRRYVENCARIV